MVKINIRWKTAEDFNILRGSSLGTKVKYFWRKGWIEVPVLMMGSFALVAGLAMTSYALHYSNTHDMTPKYFKTPRNRTIREFRRSVMSHISTRNE